MLGIIAEKPQESIGVGEGGQEAAGWGEAKLSYPRFGATCSVAARTAARACAGEQLRLGSVQGNRVWGWDGQSDWQAADQTVTVPHRYSRRLGAHLLSLTATQARSDHETAI